MTIKLAQLVVEAAQAKKASRVVLLDVRGKSDLCDYQVICSAESDRQAQAICDFVETECRTKGHIKPAAVEGRQSANWILLDYGALIVHIFLGPLRDYYGLESLWQGATVDLASLS